MRLILLTLLFISLIFQGCDVLRNDNNLDPFYLEIADIDLAVNDLEGSDTHNIKDAWIIVDGQDLGVFELPITVPILPQSSTTNFRIFAGIRQNGIQSFPIEYPFYESIEFDIDGIAGETYTREFTFNYSDFTAFEIIDDFETATFFTNEVDNFDDSFFELKEDDEIIGNSAGVFYANLESPVCEIATSVSIPLEMVQGRKPYLEIDYKGTAPLQIGLRGLSGTIIESKYAIILKPRDTWNKLYLDLTDFINMSNFSQFSILLGIDLRGFPDEEGEAWVDNVKLVRFQ